MSDSTKTNKNADSSASADADAEAATSSSSVSSSSAFFAGEPEPATDDEPLCLENATPNAVPLHLRQMLSEHNGKKVSSVELLMLLIYLVALESGFVEDNTYVEKRDQLKTVPPVGCFHIYNVRLLSQHVPSAIRSFQDAPIRMILRTLVDESAIEQESTVTMLQSHFMAVILGDLLMITLSPAPPSKEPGHSICLSIGRHVLNVQLKPVFKRFSKLDELSLQLKEKLFQPMRAQQLLALKVYMYPSLLSLPNTLYDEIFKLLNENQLNIVANVHTQLSYYRKEFRRLKESKKNRQK